MRRPTAMLAAALVLLTVCGGVTPAVAATAPAIQVDRTDPLQTDPVTVRVAAPAADGSAAAFTGSLTLSVGGTRATVAAAAASGGVAVVAIPTGALQSGFATLVARLRVGGAVRTLTLPWFAEIPPAVEVSGFSCTAIPPGGGTIRWAVDRMGGDPVRTPNSRDAPLLPYVPSSSPRWTMTRADGRPLTTSGTVTVLQGTARVAVLRLGTAVRRLVFGAPWNGRVRGAFRPGAYTARLVLRDAAGRTTTAVQAVQVVATGIAPCGT